MPLPGEMLDALERIDMRLDSIDVTLVKQSKDLEYHIARTDLLEEHVKPLRDSHQQVLGALKLLALVGVIVALLEGLKTLSMHS